MIIFLPIDWKYTPLPSITPNGALMVVQSSKKDRQLAAARAPQAPDGLVFSAEHRVLRT